MKSGNAIALMVFFVTGTAYAQGNLPQPRKALAQVAHASNGAATRTARAGLSKGTLVAIGAGAAAVVAAIRNNGTTHH